MQKMSVSVPDSTMEAIDVEAKRLGVSRSHFVAGGIDFYIGSGRNLKNEIDKLNEELMIKTEKTKSLSDKVLKLEERIPTIESQSRMKDYDINRINNELAQKINENKSLSEKVLQLEESVPTIENKLAEAMKELNSKAERDEKFKSKVSELEQLNTQIDQLRNQLNEAEKLKERIGSALQAKEEEIAFLRGHVAQLTQGIGQLSLPPSQEEARTKHWYQFWK
jgi:chromosome segregation ATPase